MCSDIHTYIDCLFNNIVLIKLINIQQVRDCECCWFYFSPHKFTLLSVNGRMNGFVCLQTQTLNFHLDLFEGDRQTDTI